MKFFRPAEFQCKCTKCGLGFAQMKVELLERLDMARLLANVPMSINSAIRCPEHNQKVGGLDNSAHLTGHAVDIATPNGHYRMRILYGLLKAGFNRIGIYADFVHADVDQTKPKDVVWLE